MIIIVVYHLLTMHFCSRFDKQGFRTEFQLDLMEKVRGRLKKTGIWNVDAGVNYTLTSEEIGTQISEKLANKTLRVVTTPVPSCSHLTTVACCTVLYFMRSLRWRPLCSTRVVAQQKLTYDPRSLLINTIDFSKL